MLKIKIPWSRPFVPQCLRNSYLDLSRPRERCVLAVDHFGKFRMDRRSSVYERDLRGTISSNERTGIARSGDQP